MGVKRRFGVHCRLRGIKIPKIVVRLRESPTAGDRREMSLGKEKPHGGVRTKPRFPSKNFFQ